MSDMIERAEVLRIFERRFSGTMLGDILKADVARIPAVKTGDRISRCELFNRLATITAEDANDMKAKIYAVIQEMEAMPYPEVEPYEVEILGFSEDRVDGAKAEIKNTEPKFPRKANKPIRAVWVDGEHNEIGKDEPQTERSE